MLLRGHLPPGLLSPRYHHGNIACQGARACLIRSSTPARICCSIARTAHAIAHPSVWEPPCRLLCCCARANAPTPCNATSSRKPARTRWSGFTHILHYRWLTCTTLQNLGRTSPLARLPPCLSRPSEDHGVLPRCSAFLRSLSERATQARAHSCGVHSQLGFSPSCPGCTFSPTTIWAPDTPSWML